MGIPKQQRRSCRNGMIALDSHGTLCFVPAYCGRKVCPSCGEYKFKQQLGAFRDNTQHLEEMWVAILYTQRQARSVKDRCVKIGINKSLVLSTAPETRLSVTQTNPHMTSVPFIPLPHADVIALIGDFTTKYGHKKWVSSWPLTTSSKAVFIGRGNEFQLREDLEYLGYTLGSTIEDPDYLRTRLYVLQRERSGADSEVGSGVAMDDDEDCGPI